jgi:Helix-turn-helix domain
MHAGVTPVRLRWNWGKQRTENALALQSRIVSLAADGLRNTEIGELLAISRGTAALWHARFAEHQRDGLLDEPRLGRPRPIGDAKVEGLMVRALAVGNDPEGCGAPVDAVDGPRSGSHPAMIGDGLNPLTMR